MPPFSKVSATASNGMGAPCHHRLHRSVQYVPVRDQMVQTLRAFCREGVIDTTAAIHRPAPRFQCPAFFESVQHGIDNTFAGRQRLAGAQCNRLDDLIAVHFLVLQQTQDHQLWHPSAQAVVFVSHLSIYLGRQGIMTEVLGLVKGAYRILTATLAAACKVRLGSEAVIRPRSVRYPLCAKSGHLPIAGDALPGTCRTISVPVQYFA